jgi:hypothetical protein
MAIDLERGHIGEQHVLGTVVREPKSSLSLSGGLW